MSGLLRRSSVFYLTHLFTFSLIGLQPILFSKYGAFIVMSALVPVWMSSSVLFSERLERYRFLRTLPITSREVVNIKLMLILMAGGMYLGLISLIILMAGDKSGHLPVNFSMTFSCGLFGILLAFFWQICIWRFGISSMTPAIIISAGILLLLVIIGLASFKGRPNLIGINDIRIFQILSQPLWFVLLLVMAGTAFYGLWQLAFRVFEQCEPD